jgi:FixJ family two-component response regulator
MTATGERTVFIVEDDIAVRDSLALLLGSKGYRTSIFGNAEDFLAAYRPDGPSCVVWDIEKGPMDGSDLQARLAAEGIALPIVIVTAHGDAASSW